MSTYPFYQIDAFASKAFEGNQACVMPMDAFLSDDILLAIAAENNVAETAYIVPVSDGRWKLRWFTPAIEVPLCGHATLASAHVLFQHLGYEGNSIVFETMKSGELVVERAETGYLMDFPAPAVVEAEITEEIVTALGARPVAAFAGPFYAAIFETPDEIYNLTPDIAALKSLGASGNMERGNFGCLSPGGDGVDVTSRFFAPGSGIDEDPATGSWHCMLAAVMSPRLGKTDLNCFQAYPGRGGRIGTHLVGQRVKLKGQAVSIVEGMFSL
jgi:PhzF family phenazine biosynthesis protein